MIPYFAWTSFRVGPLTIQVWGLLVALGMVTAIWLGSREARRRGLSSETFVDFASTIMLGAFIGSRIFHVVAYEPAAYLADPLRILRVWEGGLSSIGGFMGAALASWWFVRRHNVRYWPYADVACYALPLGYAIGRVGCFLIHDHPGTLSHSFIAVQYPGGARIDHGLLLALLGFAIFASFYAINRRGTHAIKGFLPLFMVFYGVPRFFFDFWRATDGLHADARYLGLTPAQYASLAMVAGGLWLWSKRDLWRAKPHAHSGAAHGA